MENNLDRKQAITGTVVQMTLGSAMIDIGQDKPGFLHISHMISENPINRIEDLLTVGQEVKVWVSRIDKKTSTVELTMVEPLALEWREITKGLKLSGKVTRIEKFGVFVDIGAERAGLIHISELSHDYVRDPHDVLKVDEEIEVEVIDFNRRKKQIKLSRKATLEAPEPEYRESYQQQADVQEEEEEDNTPVPTAMEMALRAAMDKTKGSEEKAGKTKKTKVKSQAELDSILSRTLTGYSSDK